VSQKKEAATVFPDRINSENLGDPAKINGGREICNKVGRSK
jgi:hypothetical protein